MAVHCGPDQVIHGGHDVRVMIVPVGYSGTIAVSDNRGILHIDPREYTASDGVPVEVTVTAPNYGTYTVTATAGSDTDTCTLQFVSRFAQGSITLGTRDLSEWITDVVEAIDVTPAFRRVPLGEGGQARVTSSRLFVLELERVEHGDIWGTMDAQFRLSVGYLPTQDIKTQYAQSDMALIAGALNRATREGEIGLHVMEGIANTLDNGGQVVDYTITVSYWRE